LFGSGTTDTALIARVLMGLKDGTKSVTKDGKTTAVADPKNHYLNMHAIFEKL